MKWVLIVVWMTAGHGGGVTIAEFPTLKECFVVGKRAEEQFDRLFDTHVTNFSCAPSHGEEPTCGGTGQQPCKDL